MSYKAILALVGLSVYLPYAHTQKAGMGTYRPPLEMHTNIFPTCYFAAESVLLELSFPFRWFLLAKLPT